MRPLIRVVSCLILPLVAYAQPPDAPSFEVASVKVSSPDVRARACGGGPGTASPGIWRCSNVPLAFVISYAYGFEAYQFSPRESCCQASFDFEAKVPAGATKAQFRQMLQNLLVERFQFKFHYQEKEMPVFELVLGEKGSKLKPSPPDAMQAEPYPWEPTKYTLGDDGYPVFPEGQGGLAGGNDHYRWTAFHVSLPEIVKTLSFYLGRPVIDKTGIQGNYDLDLKWGIGRRDEAAEVPDTGPTGPPLNRAVQDQLGLKLNAKKGPGKVVVVDHVEKVPVAN
ncbi:MAG: TIGR03435 family protein [Candidatus Sulfopaludibacter sp.]|nr:TIGR03435 family protein [Candidatus Sulfopaludibacter sp.]